MSFENFDYGADLAATKSFTRENPVEGLHLFRLRSLIHLGCCPQVFDGKAKDPVNFMAAVLELKEESDVHSETGEPLTFTLEFPLRDGSKSFLHSKFLPALASKKDLESGAIKSMDDLIGKLGQISLKPSKATNEDGTPKYMNLDSISAAHPSLQASIPALSIAGVGHCRLKDLTVDAIDELNSYTQVQMLMMKSDEWVAGTHPAIPLVEEIRKERPDFAKAKPKDEEKPSGNQQSGDAPTQGDAPPENLQTDEEF